MISLQVGLVEKENLAQVTIVKDRKAKLSRGGNIVEDFMNATCRVVSAWTERMKLSPKLETARKGLTRRLMVLKNNEMQTR